MSRPDTQKTILDMRIAKLRREGLKLERFLVREAKKREMPCRCQGGGYIYTQQDFEEIREIYETARARWLAAHTPKTEPRKTEPRLIESVGDA